MAMTLVSSVTLTNSTSTQFDFLNIPQTGKDLLILVSARTTTVSGSTDLNLIVNDVQTTSYTNLRLRGSGTTASTTSQNATSLSHPVMPGANVTANTFGSTRFYLPNYATTNTKNFSIESVTENNAASAEARMIAGRNTTVSTGITKISIYDSSGGAFVSGTTAALYIIS